MGKARTFNFGKSMAGLLLFCSLTLSVAPGCTDSSELFDLLRICPDRVWFKVDKRSTSDYWFLGTQTESTNIYMWEKTGRLVKAYHADGASLHVPIAEYQISPSGGFFWLTKEDGTLQVWDSESEKHTRVCDRVKNWGHPRLGRQHRGCDDRVAKSQREELYRFRGLQQGLVHRGRRLRPGPGDLAFRRRACLCRAACLRTRAPAPRVPGRGVG